MNTKAGVGFSTNTRSKEAAKEAAKNSLSEQTLNRADIAMVFATAKHDFQEIHAGLRDVFGTKTKIIGGGAVGIITNDKLSYGGYEVGVAAIESKDIHFSVLSQTGLGTGQEYKMGTDLAKQIRDHKDVHSVLMFFDWIRGQKDAPLNMATPMLAGMQKVFGNSWPMFAGAGLFGDMQMNPTAQICNDTVVTQSILALVASGNCQLDTVILHGCKPSSDYHTITKVDGPVVLEIDGRKATDVITELLGPGHEDWQLHPLFITLGVTYGHKYEKFKEENYANRLCMSIDKERGGLIMFEPDLKPGDEFQLMRRSIDTNYIQIEVDRLMKKASDRQPFFAFYIDCAGRAANYSGAQSEEAAEVQKALADRVPFLGMYSGVEIAMLGKEVRALDWTGVLCLLSQ